MSEDLIKRSDTIAEPWDMTTEDCPNPGAAVGKCMTVIRPISSVDRPQGRYIDADALVTVCLYDDEHEERYTECMSVEKCLDFFTEEGCPNPVDRPQLAKDIVEPISNGNVIMSEDTYEDLLDRPQGEWVATKDFDEWYGLVYECNICGSETIGGCDNYCPNCGARMFVKDINVPNKKGADDEVD